jgi:hypothetical protein
MMPPDTTWTRAWTRADTADTAETDEEEEAEDEEEAVHLCACGDVLTVAEAQEDVESAVGVFMDAHFSIQPYSVLTHSAETDKRILNRSRIYYTFGRARAALKNEQLARTSGDEAYVLKVHKAFETTGCSCDPALCRDYKCCRMHAD